MLLLEVLVILSEESISPLLYRVPSALEKPKIGQVIPNL